MSLEFEMPLFSLIFIFLLAVVYFTKPSIKLSENKYYGMIIVFSLIETFLSSIVHFICAFNDFDFINTKYYPFINFANKIVTTAFVGVFICLLIYVMIISYEKIRKNEVKIKIGLLFFIILFFIVTFFTKIILVEENYVTNVKGSTPFLGYIFIAIFIIASFIVAILNIKKYDKRYLSIFFVIPLMGCMYAMTVYFPSIILYDLVLALLCYIMYFTIENPDLKLISELNIAKTQAEKANNAKTEFLSSMSHEIRTPLNAVVGFSESLLEENISEEAKEQAKYIVSSSESLLEIVNGILDISKIEANKLEIINSEYSFKKIFDDLVSISKSKLGERQIEFITEYDESIPGVFYGDYTRVKQIILNLLTNAIKYTKEGYIKFKVDSIINGNTCRLIINVEDSGIGIKKENIDKLFTKFERLQVEKNTTAEGTGLGLAITKKLVELMNGKITVQSTVDKGSKFSVILDQEIVKGKTILDDIEEKIDYNKKDYTSYKILVVDDNIVNIKVAARLLKNYNIALIECKSGQECIDKINDGEKFDLLLLDDMMPGMSGTETFKKLKENEEFKIPTVCLTANAISGMKEKYLKLGFDDYLAKPIDRKELDRILKKYLGGKK